MIAGWVILLGALIYNRQGIVDAVRMHGYTAPADIVQIADADTMTDQARHIFYVNYPQIASKQVFSGSCPSGTEGTVVLGCYQSNQAGIFVLSVTDSRLAGVEQVTAAHEMLHAAYDRLSSRQKASIDAQLQAFYETGLTDQTVKRQIDDYKKTEPQDVQNEMHSLFATEVAQLPPQLEQYYTRYFKNRAAVIILYNNYEAEFTKRQAVIKADDNKLLTLKTQIDSQSAALAQQATTLDSERRELESRRSSGDVAGYNADVDSFNRAVASYNAQAAAVRALIQQYNTLVDQRNTVAAETNQLTSELSSQVPSVQ